jgi:hypothetical protein
MKIRQGWVSNSSSSSFLIAWDPAVPLKDRLTDLLAVPIGHPLKGFVEGIAEEMAEKEGNTIETQEDLDRYVEENYLDEEDVAEQRALLSEGYLIRFGEYESDAVSHIERWLSENDFNYTGPGIKVFHDGGY